MKVQLIHQNKYMALIYNIFQDVKFASTDIRLKQARVAPPAVSMEKVNIVQYSLVEYHSAKYSNIGAVHILRDTK